MTTKIPATDVELIAQSEALRALSERIGAGGAVDVIGVQGSSAVLAAAAVRDMTGRMLLLVTAHLDDADEAIDELQQRGIEAVRFPAMELVVGQTTVSPDLVADRIALAQRLASGSYPDVIIAPIQALMQGVPGAEAMGRVLRSVRPGDRVDPTELAGWLASSGYARVPAIDSPGEFAVRGGIVDVFTPGGLAVRIDLFGDEVEALNEIDLDTMGSDRRLDVAEIVGASLDQLQSDDGSQLLTEAMPANTVAALLDLREITEQARSYFDRARETGGLFGPPTVFKSISSQCHATIQFAAHGEVGRDGLSMPVAPLPLFDENVGQAMDELVELTSTHGTIVYCNTAGEAQRVRELFSEHAPGVEFAVCERYLHRGFIWLDPRDGARPLAFVPYHELLHRYQTRRRVRRIASSRAMDTFVDLEPGDYVVHRDHGVARYLGMRTMQLKDTDADEEYLTLEFAKNAKLHVPAAQLHLVQKYIGAFRGEPELATLGGRKWKRQKEKVREAVRDLAAEMLRIQAAREAMPGIRYPGDSPWLKEFEASFPYEETDDQLTAIEAVKRDMMSPRPMDRLVCGDVGFGKTEVAIRAAFKAVEFGKQVAVLVPTTVLAEQHERTFRDRFADYPFRIESLSRFKTRKEQGEVLKAAGRGEVDVLVGTHRLLSEDVKFADLGMVIIDEEQRFGVEHKQRLLELRATVDVLTLSATPIPRTLHMSMLGLRDISSLATAPADRRAIVTEVMGHNTTRIRSAIERELAREGQVFYVHNRVHNIEDVASEVQQMAPDARVIIGHGQMPPRQLERVMLQFIRRQADILVSTTIIESGIDIPTANTMIINDAHIFGLAELHQLRGRVGRHKHRAYCYLLLPQDKSISEVAVKRLHALESYSMLGAGFKIAMRDLEIRGAGNLLGPEQSGHISAVGYEMYCQLLEQMVEELRTGQTSPRFETTIDIGIAGTIAKGYIPSDARRLDAYRRLSRAASAEEVQRIERDLVSAYGELPKSAQTFIALSEIRAAASSIGVRSIRRMDRDIIFDTANPRELERRMSGAHGTLRIVTHGNQGGTAELYYRPPKNYLESDSLLTVLRHRLTAAHDDLRSRPRSAQERTHAG